MIGILARTMNSRGSKEGKAKITLRYTLGAAPKYAILMSTPSLTIQAYDSCSIAQTMLLLQGRSQVQLQPNSYAIINGDQNHV